MTMGVMAWVLAAGMTVAQVPFPAPDGRINDFANLLDAEQEARLTAMVQEVEDETTAEIAVATVPSLGGMSVEEYANRLFAQWGVGKADADNGVLILVAPNEREMRIEVGYGLEPILPDGLAGEVIREVFLPHFREGDYASGILDGTTRIAAIVRRNQTLTEEERQALARGDEPPLWIFIPFFGLFVAVGAGMGGAGVSARAGGALLFSAMFTGIPMLMALVIVPRWGLLVLLAICVVAFVVGWRAARNPKTRASLRGSSSSKGGWVWGSGSGSGGSGGGWSSGSSGGFGGGSSGGGGASGRW